MILIDFSQVVLSNVIQLQTSKTTRTELTLDFVRHLILNSIKNIRLRFPEEAKDTVLCCDSRDYWRKDIFPYYKANREKLKAQMPGIDWAELFEYMNIVKQEIRDHVPVRLIEVERCEADDIIATLCVMNEARAGSGSDDSGLFDSGDGPKKDKVIIISTDGDFLQLQIFPSVRQFSMPKKAFLTPPGGPEQFLKEKIIRGDAGDGIPNIMSESDTFVTQGKRQKRMTEGKFSTYINDVPGNYDQEARDNYSRNEALIDLLNKIPDKYAAQIKEAYEAAQPVRGRLYSYLLAKGLKQIASNPAGLD